MHSMIVNSHHGRQFNRAQLCKNIGEQHSCVGVVVVNIMHMKKHIWILCFRDLLHADLWHASVITLAVWWNASVLFMNICVCGVCMHCPEEYLIQLRLIWRRISYENAGESIPQIIYQDGRTRSPIWWSPEQTNNLIVAIRATPKNEKVLYLFADG